MSPIGDAVTQLLCRCNTAWGSITPPPPCPAHESRVYNGLCQCRGPFALHPFHSDSIWTAGHITTTTVTAPPTEYVGRHRKPE